MNTLHPDTTIPQFSIKAIGFWGQSAYPLASESRHRGGWFTSSFWVHLDSHRGIDGSIRKSDRGWNRDTVSVLRRVACLDYDSHAAASSAKKDNPASAPRADHFGRADRVLDLLDFEDVHEERAGTPRAVRMSPFRLRRGV